LRFGVIVTTNMFGDMLSDEASELCGSIGLGSSINAGEDVCMAQAQHGSAPDIQGLGIANPTSLERVRACPTHRTRDLGGRASTSEFASAVAGAITERVPSAPTRDKTKVL
jgi:isocitrate/isopropylmalate dehydrogenase